jgi:hypothetical protein
MLAEDHEEPDYSTEPACRFVTTSSRSLKAGPAGGLRPPSAGTTLAYHPTAQITGCAGSSLQGMLGDMTWQRP